MVEIENALTTDVKTTVQIIQLYLKMVTLASEFDIKLKVNKTIMCLKYDIQNSLRYVNISVSLLIHH